MTDDIHQGFAQREETSPWPLASTNKLGNHPSIAQAGVGENSFSLSGEFRMPPPRSPCHKQSVEPVKARNPKESRANTQKEETSPFPWAITYIHENHPSIAQAGKGKGKKTGSGQFQIPPPRSPGHKKVVKPVKANNPRTIQRSGIESSPASARNIQKAHKSNRALLGKAEARGGCSSYSYKGGYGTSSLSLIHSKTSHRSPADPQTPKAALRWRHKKQNKLTITP
ncbi:hypothetical protein CPC08DRAFT_755467 [Agrocybe pediades]|nr:hypothetical protein CPC08DRAFT_755467 [Agrocybe pediades]